MPIDVCRDLNCQAHGKMLRRIRRLQLAVVELRREKNRQSRADRGAGWDRAHTMLCPDVYPACRHRNPWMITRGTT
jgi:hypothetical protein